MRLLWVYLYKKWYRYISENQKAHIHKDSCIKCRKYKTAEYVENKYGVSNVFQLDDIKEKLGKTNIEKYGVANPFSSELIKEKIKKTNLEKYGVEYATQSEIIKEKTKQTIMEKYGTPYSPFLDITHEKGEKNPQWKGGALRNGLFRNTYEYKEWHEAVLKRDNYTCQCCGIKSGCGHRVSIHTHHIYNFASNVDKRFDVDNGICLCKKCHYAFHSAYGFVNTTQEQLDEFILNHGKKIC